MASHRSSPAVEEPPTSMNIQITAQKDLYEVPTRFINKAIAIAFERMAEAAFQEGEATGVSIGNDSYAADIYPIRAKIHFSRRSLDMAIHLYGWEKEPT
jgi:hypothetical protein